MAVWFSLTVRNACRVKPLLLFSILAICMPAAAPVSASLPDALDAKPPAKQKPSTRCVERKLDVKTGMMITRFGCTRSPQGRWRDVGKALGSPAPP